MNPTTPSPQAATERFAERFGEISQGLAANGGGDRLSALLIQLIERLIQAILSIARNLPARRPGRAGRNRLPPEAATQHPGSARTIEGPFAPPARTDAARTDAARTPGPRGR